MAQQTLHDPFGPADEFPIRLPEFMESRTGPKGHVAAIAVAILLASAAFKGHAEEFSEWSTEYWGTVGMEGRMYLNPPAHAGQKSNDVSLTVKPTLYLEGPESGSITFTPYARIDGSDRNRTHVDIREAYYLVYGSLEETEWELRLGIDQVFWGTAESNNLVNVVNQTDLVDSPGGKEKLGQPMIHGTLSGEWGSLGLLVLPYHRPRTFPGTAGRLRGRFPISTEKHLIKYESSSGDRHIDLAARYSNSFGPLDVGLSAFDGTSREPFVELNPDLDIFQQNYNLIKQIGLDLQLTMDAFLGKAEIIKRKGFNTTGADKSSHHAFVVGGEYSIYGVFDSEADLTLFAEWNHDNRDAFATTALQNDLFVAARYTFNDVEDTSITAAVVGDLDYDTKTLNLEFNRRLSDYVSLKAEAFAFLDTDTRDRVTSQISEDEFVTVRLNYSF